MKFIHAADLHVDSPLRGLDSYDGAPVDRLRGASRQALIALVDLALEQRVAFVLLAGDIYDGNWADFRTGLFFREQMLRLRRAGILVFMVKGNHDAESQITKQLPEVEGVHVFSAHKSETIDLEALGVAVHGRSFPHRAVPEDLVPFYPDPLPGRFNIGLLHTSLTGREGHDPYAPTSVEALCDKGYDYFALGHVHAREVVRPSDPRIVFPGNLQGRHAKETGPKGCELVTVEGGVITAAEFVPLEVVRWHQFRLDASGLASVDALARHFMGQARELVADARDRLHAVRLLIHGESVLHRLEAEQPGSIAAAIQAAKRLAASAEAIDQHRRDLAEATADVATETEQVIRLAARIDVSRSAEAVSEHAPARTERVRIEQLLHAVELAEQALGQHQESGRQTLDAEESTAAALPSPESRTVLRIAQAELARSLIDELASDTERAAALQSSKRQIETLERDCRDLKDQLEELDRDEASRQVTWHQTIAGADLPNLSPAALRDWQALLPAARTACEALQSKLDEFAQVQATEQVLASQLRAAIIGTGLAVPTEDARLSTLLATAADVDAEINQRETAINRAAGKRLERERQLQKNAARENELTSALLTAKDALKPALAGLLLPEDTTVAVARARIGEFEDLLEAKDRLAAAQSKERRASQALTLLDDAAKAIWQVLGGPEPADLRLYVEQVFARLNAAEAVQTERTLAQQALEAAQKTQREHKDTGGRHQQVLSALCLAAGVESANQLPEAEEQSRRKREAQSEVDRSNSQMALASWRSVDELRTLLADYDAARMDADEMSFSDELNQLEPNLQAAREHQELARRALEAIDGSDTAVAAREDMERAAASVRANMSPWIRSRLAHALLAEALKRFRDRAQGPMLTAASSYFSRMTRGELVRLISDDSDKEPALIAERSNGSRIRVEEMSEGTLDQLYLALRLAALDLRRAAGVDLPLILDDVLMTSDEDRSGSILEALADFAGENQVLVFTHHRHMVELAQRHVPAEHLALVPL